MRSGDGAGARIAQIRKLRGLTQRALARRASVSYSLVTKVEAGHVPASPALLNAAARALQVERGELTGQPYRVDGNVAHAAVSEIRQALWAYDLPLDLDVSPRPVPELETAVAEASRLRRATAFARLAAMLPGLLDELHTAVHTTPETDRERLFGALARAYYAVECLASGLGYEDLYLLAIERYEWAARRSGDRLLVGAATRATSGRARNTSTSNGCLPATECMLATEPDEYVVAGAAGAPLQPTEFRLSSSRRSRSRTLHSDAQRQTRITVNGTAAITAAPRKL